MIRCLQSRLVSVTCKWVPFLLCVGWLALPASLSQELPRPMDDKPSVAFDGHAGGRLENGRIAATWKILNGRLVSLSIRDENAQPDAAPSTLDLAEPFLLEIQQRGVLRSADLLLHEPATVEQLQPNSSASRASDRLPGVAVHYALSDPKGAFQADWTLILRDGSSYIRQTLTLHASDAPLPLAGLVLIDIQSPDIAVSGTVKGSPLIAGNFFLALESPLAQSSVVGARGVSEIHNDVPLAAGQSVPFSSVLGVAPPGQMRRAFLAYLERERAHPYRTFLHYNSWFDIGFFSPYSQQDALNRIRAFGEELHRKRGVTLDSFLFDDGWDDTHHLWQIRSDFKDGFAPLAKAAAEYGAAPGVWLSPWGGYGPAKQARVATAQRDGYEIVDGGLALSSPRYYALFHDAVTGMVARYGVNQFKLDGTGNVDRVVQGSAFNSDFDAAVHLIGDLRKLKPDLYINLTTGTWPSPFWLFYADSIWRGGDDTGFTGVGTDRERWITYRDADTYDGIVKAGEHYPLNSLMLHGIVFAQKAPHLSTDPGGDFANEVHSYFGSGTQLQELYITPSLLNDSDWDTLAETAKWSRSNAATLVDTHWIGGDPRWLQVYGWAAWSPQKGILTLRNPNLEAQDFTLDIARAFELPTNAPRRYNAHSPWNSDAAQAPIELEAGHPYTFHLAPFQVITLEASPQE